MNANIPVTEDDFKNPYEIRSFCVRQTPKGNVISGVCTYEDGEMSNPDLVRSYNLATGENAKNVAVEITIDANEQVMFNCYSMSFNKAVEAVLPKEEIPTTYEEFVAVHDKVDTGIRNMSMNEFLENGVVGNSCSAYVISQSVRERLIDAVKQEMRYERTDYDGVMERMKKDSSVKDIKQLKKKADFDKTERD